MAVLQRDQLSRTRVLVVGDAMLDRYWHGAVDRISPEAPVPVVRVTREDLRMGGAANVAANVVALGAQATLLTVVGDDDASHMLEKLVVENGIAPHFGRNSALQTIVKLRVIGRQQQLLRLDFENSPRREMLASQTADFKRLLPTHDVILFSDYGKGCLDHVDQMIELARAADKPILVDPKGLDYLRYAGATVITPNREELRQVVGTWRDEDDLRAKAQALRKKLDLSALLLTRSEEGMTLYESDVETSATAQAREVFDVTGAGDTVIATLATLVGTGLPLRQAMPLANKAGGIVVGKFGSATVSYEELFA
ncbi:heptose 1-phosphate adenyltransferase [Hylemonella gracilis str. Niagara R]|uniref:Heptose 1-phosphate adenyltransferase n=1 Tax=Hylemonella gracilis str. Niagara R TaxID=1458275 RepID=A0A016XEK4_9BURK|nr:D-glycero-beta-D-manno-heptose-7-phosphate kinase [Hylemonella gracilis]EYC50350.1 heptose 1-phosphate adenyltransferase [Hylemonella gracilis str. Niagara R]